MHKLILLATLATIPALAAQAQKPQSLAEKLAAKQKSKFLAKAEWSLSLADAKRHAKAEDNLIFAYFTRSYEP